MWKVIMPVEYRDRIVAEAGGPRKVHRWLYALIQQYFSTPDPNSELAILRQDVLRLKGEVDGLRYALSLRPGGVYTIHESTANGQYHVNSDGGAAGQHADSVYSVNP